MKGNFTATLELNYTEQDLLEAITEDIDYYNGYYEDEPFTRQDLDQTADSFLHFLLGNNALPDSIWEEAYDTILADLEEVYDKHYFH